MLLVMRYGPRLMDTPTSVPRVSIWYRTKNLAWALQTAVRERVRDSQLLVPSV